MITFITQGLKHLWDVGTVFPSSPYLARSMAQTVARAPSPRRVLEVGSGTGAITREILPILDDGDVFDLIEINPLFCRHLEQRMLDAYRAEHPRVAVTLRCEPLETASFDARYDAIVCSLPFRAFTAPIVRRLLRRMTSLLADTGELTYMEYIGAATMKTPFVRRRRRTDLRRIDAICRRIDSRHDRSYNLVVRNLLPARVVRLRAAEDAPAAVAVSSKPQAA